VRIERLLFNLITTNYQLVSRTFSYMFRGSVLCSEAAAVSPPTTAFSSLSNLLFSFLKSPDCWLPVRLQKSVESSDHVSGRLSSFSKNVCVEAVFQPLNQSNKLLF